MPQIDLHQTSQPAFFFALFIGAATIPSAITSTSPGTPLVLGAVRSSPQRTYAEVVPKSDQAVVRIDPRKSTDMFGDMLAASGAERPTTPAEEAVGTIREMSLLQDNWDGEGGRAPLPTSVDQAVRFVFLMAGDVPIPEPMLMATGTIGLYWNEPGLYADLELLGDGRITYFIERGPADRHKGVAGFDGKVLPPVLLALLVGNRRSAAS